MARKTAADIKALIEQDKVFMEKLAALNLKLDDVIASIEAEKKPDFNQLYEEFKKKLEGGEVIVEPPQPPTPTPICGGHSHWDGTACVCDAGYVDDGTGVCIPVDVVPPADNILYDSNVYWNDGNARTVPKGGHDGDIKANGKGIFTAASGSPKVEIDGKGTATLITQPGFGRFYLCVCNFNAQLDFDFMIKSGSVDNMSIKGRCRHQAGGDPANRFGGLGNATSLTETDFKIELYHNVHDKGYNQNLSPKLELNKWYHKRYIYHNTEDDKAIKMEDWLGAEGDKDLKKVFERTETKPIAAAMDKGSFAKESWVWFRLNGSGEISFKNVKVTAL